jgi:hypothetical protein
MSAYFAALHFGRFWHVTDIGRRLLDVRFWGRSGHHAASAASASIGTT